MVPGFLYPDILLVVRDLPGFELIGVRFADNPGPHTLSIAEHRIRPIGRFTASGR